MNAACIKKISFGKRELREIGANKKHAELTRELQNHNYDLKKDKF